MAFTNDVLLKTMQILNNQGDRSDKSFLMLGKQDLNIKEDFLDILVQSGLIEDKLKFGDNERTDSVLFLKAWGYKSVHALDVSNYENADILFDLNDDLPSELENKFDVVYDGGVIEHVFDVGKAFMNICRMTKVGGYIFNLNPIYNYIHNTFYNISPEMFIDFYTANDYLILNCDMVTFLDEKRDNRSWFDRPVIWSADVRLMSLLHPLYPGEQISSMNQLCSNPHPHTYIVAKKTHAGEFMHPIPGGYLKKHREKDRTK